MKIGNENVNQTHPYNFFRVLPKKTKLKLFFKNKNIHYIKI